MDERGDFGRALSRSLISLLLLFFSGALFSGEGVLSGVTKLGVSAGVVGFFLVKMLGIEKTGGNTDIFRVVLEQQGTAMRVDTVEPDDQLWGPLRSVSGSFCRISLGGVAVNAPSRDS